MANKTLQTRISLKIDTWANWNTDAGKAHVLKRGEIAFVQIANTVPPIDATSSGTLTTEGLITNPNSILFKVGDGATDFEHLEWGSAIAADVYGWAKAASVAYNSTTQTIEFKDASGATIGNGIDLSSLASDTDLNNLKSELTALINSGGTATQNLEKRVKAIEDAPYASQSYADTAASTAAELIRTNGADKATDLTVKGVSLAVDAAVSTAAANLSDAVNNLKGTKKDGDTTAETIRGAKDYTDAAIDTFYSTYIENDSKALDTLKDVTNWLDANKDGAADIVSDITNLQNNKADKTELNKVDVRVQALEAIDHDHTNKNVLDSITATQVTNWDNANSQKHTHDNKTELDKIADGDKAKWDAYATNKADANEFNQLTNRVKAIEDDYLTEADFFYIDGGRAPTA